MMFAIILVVIGIGCIAIYSIARHNAVQQVASVQIAAVGGASALAVAAAFVLFGESPPGASADASSTIAASTVPSSNIAASTLGPSPPHPPFGTMPIEQARRLTLGARRANGGIDNFGSASYNPALHQIQAVPNKPFTISGWAASVPDKSLGSGVLILIDGKLMGTGSYGLDRLDVANYFKLSTIRYSGFSAQIPALKPGRHTLGVALGETDHSHYHWLDLMPLTLVVGG